MYIPRVSDAVQQKYVQFLEKYFEQAVVDTVRTSYGYKSEMPLFTVGLTVAQLHELGAIFPADKDVQKYLKGMLAIAKDKDAKISDLKQFPEAFLRWMTVDSIDGWLYSVKESTSDPALAWAVKSVKYHPAEGTRDRYTPAYAAIELQANGATLDRGLESASVTLDKSDIVGGKSMSEILFKEGYVKENADLKAEYALADERFRAYMLLHNQQFVATQEFQAGVGKKSRRNDWGTEYVVKIQPRDRFVNDEALISRKLTLLKDNEMFEKYGVKESEFRSVPVHPYIYLYDLQRYGSLWAHVDQVEPYTYDPTLIEKLVLAPEHKDLINVLVSDVTIFADDIVEGKSGGTPILCYGSPGLGKTLTAEVYAEVIKKPLYKVHSGMLGTTAEDVESNLKEILERGQRWDAVVLLDECDVYVAKRGTDLDKNAVVAAFLRTLEYFNGLLFMTTNRVEDVDDAIVSRMVAVFRYEPPTADMSKQLWPILAKQFGVDLTPNQLDWLLKEFPGLPGRDIKNLLKLVHKYCAYKKEKLSTSAFRVCAVFRGIK